MAVQADKEKFEPQLRQTQKMEAVGTLSGGMAHDFNNILGIILGNVDIALMKLPGQPPVLGNLKAIKIAWMVNADPTQVHRILINLYTNAAHAMEEKGGVLTVTTRPVQVTRKTLINCRKLIPGAYIELIVSDTGHGIEPGIRNRVFDPYFTTKEVGKGTRIKLYLPWCGDKPVDLHGKVLGQIPQGSGETILLVEDDPSILKLTQILLQGWGFAVVAAATPSQALDRAKAHAGEIRLLLTDLILPEMNGRQLSKCLKSIYPDIKCVFMSGYTAEIIAHHGVLDKGGCFIQKPFSGKELATVVRKALEVKKT